MSAGPYNPGRDRESRRRYRWSTCTFLLSARTSKSTWVFRTMHRTATCGSISSPPCSSSALNRTARPSQESCALPTGGGTWSRYGNPVGSTGPCQRAALTSGRDTAVVRLLAQIIGTRAPGYAPRAQQGAKSLPMHRSGGFTSLRRRSPTRPPPPYDAWHVECGMPRKHNSVRCVVRTAYATRSRRTRT